MAIFEVPSLQVLRGKRPPALKWPKAERKSVVPQPPAQHWSRVPVAINALGEDDPAISFLKESLHVVQCQVRPVGQRIEATQELVFEGRSASREPAKSQPELRKPQMHLLRSQRGRIIATRRGTVSNSSAKVLHQCLPIWPTIFGVSVGMCE